MNRRILVVDDDPHMVGTLRDILELHGWTVDTAADGEAAVRAVMDQEYAAVVMDILMPRLNGVDALAAMRRHRPTLSVVLLTAYAAHDLIARARTEGVLTVLSKPVEIADLVRLLERSAGRVLVVDDDPAFLATLADLLSSHGYHVARARGLDEAIETLADGPSSVVVLDLILNGLEPAKAVTALHEASPGVLFILYSGHPVVLDETAAAVPPTWVRACLHKPFDPATLLAALA